MFHLVASARSGRLLFRTWEEGRHLFNLLLDVFPETEAAVVMPDHLHLMLPHADPSRRLRNVMSGHAQWLSHHRAGRDGSLLWRPAPPPEALVDEQKQRRSVRYLHLNPCRKGLAPDPLAWPLSTHRDRVGLGCRAFEAPRGGPDAFHAYVSSDPTVHPRGTSLPFVQYDDFDLLAVRDAVSAVLRWPIETAPGPRVRSVFVATAAAHELFDRRRFTHADVGAMLGVGRGQVHRLRVGSPHRGARVSDPELAAAIRVVGDPRFGPLTGEDLARRPEWRSYAGKR